MPINIVTNQQQENRGIRKETNHRLVAEKI